MIDNNSVQCHRNHFRTKVNFILFINTNCICNKKAVYIFWNEFVDGGEPHSQNSDVWSLHRCHLLVKCVTIEYLDLVVVISLFYNMGIWDYIQIEEDLMWDLNIMLNDFLHTWATI